MKKEQYRITKVPLSPLDISAQKNRTYLKIYVVTLALIFVLFFFAAFAALIALGLTIFFSLVLFFKKLIRKRNK